MLNKIKILSYIIIVPGIIMAHDLSVHMYVGSQTFDVWQDFDPIFYNALVAAQAGWETFDVSKLMLIKFYYIGLTLPDLLLPSGQGTVKAVVNMLYSASGLLIDPLRILQSTYNNIQTPIQFPSGDNSHNLAKLYQMVQYAKNQNWPPAQKALIYGAFMHVVQDLYGHCFMQSSRFGYGKCYDSDSAASQIILRYAETYHELFSPTHIPDWERFIRPLYATRLEEDRVYKSYLKDACTFYRVIEIKLGTITPWQDTNFVEVQRFVSAANAVGWTIQNLTQERLESYLHGWAILTFLFYGYTKDNYSGTMGGIFAHPNWSFTYIMENFWWNIGLQGSWAWDILHDLPSSQRDMLLNVIATKVIYKLNFLAFLSGSTSWYEYFQTINGLAELWSMVPQSYQTPEASLEFHRAHRNLLFWQTTGGNYVKEPRLRTSYNEEPSLAVQFKNLYKTSVNQGPAYLDLKWNNLDVWTIARKAGLLGGLYDVGASDFPQQPGIIDLHYVIPQGGGFSHVYDYIEVETNPSGGIEYDMIYFPCGMSAIEINLMGRRNDGSTFVIGSDYHGYEDFYRSHDVIIADLENAVLNGATEIFWEIRVRNPSNQWALMLKSDYRDAYQQSSMVYNNKTYQQWFNNGDPTRTAGQNPLTDPLKYWPCTVKLYRLNRPVNLMFNPVVYGGVQLYWTDNSQIEDGFKIERKVGTGSYSVVHTTGPNETSWYDDDIEPYYNQQIRYRIRAFKGSYDSDTSNSVVFTPPGIFSDTIKAIDYYHSSRNLFRDNNGNYHLVLKHHNRLWYTKSTDNGQTWSLARNLAWTGPEAPSVVATSTGLPCFVWQEVSGSAPNYTYDLVYAYIDDLGNIHKTTLIASASHSLSPSMAITSDNHIYIAFLNKDDANKITCVKFNYNNPQYSLLCEFTNCNDPQRIRIVSDNQNRLQLVWDEYWEEPYNNWWFEVRKIWHGWFDGIPRREEVGKGEVGAIIRRVSSADVIAISISDVKVIWSSVITHPSSQSGKRDILYRAKTSGGWTNPINVTQDPEVGDYPDCARLMRDNILCLADNKIFVNYVHRPDESIALVSNVNGYDAIPILGEGILPKSAIVYSMWSGVPKLYRICFTIKTIPYVGPPTQQVYASPPGTPPEMTCYNNSRRFVNLNGVRHLVFTSGNEIYHTYLADTLWAEPVAIGQGKYPALALDNNGRIHCIWSYNQGLPYLLEELRYSLFDGYQWSTPISLMHTYNSFLWGVGAPSLAIKDSIAYITFKSYSGPTYHPAPGAPAPQVIVLESRNLIYGRFNIHNPADFRQQSIDAISITPTPYDPYVYQDSLVPLLISPSITVDLAGITHILWEGDSTNIRYYTIMDTTITAQIFDENVDFPFIGMNGDQIQLFYTAGDSIRYRYSWTGTTNLSQTQTIATCESPISSGQYLTWTKKEDGISHLYYGAIPASGPVNPTEVNYSTDLISYPQILFNSQPPSIDLVWAEYSEIDSVGYIYYLNLPLTEVAPKYAFDMGTETPVPILVQRDGYKVLGPEDYKTFDYDSTELIYHLTLHSPHIKYKIRWAWYHEEQNKIKLQFNIDDIFHHNRWVNPGEKIIEEAWIPDACIHDNEITIKVKVLNGTIAVLSGFEVYTEEVGGGGPQGGEAQILKPFYFDRIYPNPAKGILRVRFNSPDERKVIIKLYDVLGRLVHEQNIRKSKIGMNEVLIRPKDLANGVYFLKLEAGDYRKTEKAILLK